ncbi:MAG: hydrogenase expression/formation protein HypE [Methanomassiliicoccales archaeon]|nr:hydrogenase expression/formation protein HypE [Methanomassiliicoccales archaeon]NYT15788.1 hydrogenase expression/formation protein HypE [Methanomassiliicoccales archaeon]
MKRITMGHGAGGEMMQELISKHIAPFLPDIDAEVPLRSFDDSAIIDGMVFTTDAHTVKPLFFPGGDIGSLAVCGTINDISVMGACPVAMSCAMVLEEGLEIDTLEKVMQSIGQYSELSGIPVVTGDTKVVESGAVDQMIVVTSALGKECPYLQKNFDVASRSRKVANRWLTDDNVGDGDAIIVSGTLGDHGIALLSFREGYGFESAIKSDVAPLHRLIASILELGGVTSMKDMTRGGMANTLNEWSSKSKVGIEIDEPQIPIHPAVGSACELLGLDPLTIGNEGKIAIACVPEMAEDIVKLMRKSPLAKNAAIIGRATNEFDRVVMKTEVGGRRIIDPPVGDPVPRIC